MVTINPFDFFLDPEAETWPFIYDPALDNELASFLKADKADPTLAALLADIPREPKRTVTMLIELNQRIQRQIEYVVRMEPGVQTPEETLTIGRGSCRDSAWLMVQLLRHLGFAARFVSGYLVQLAPDIRPLEGPAGPLNDFTDLHAWTEVYLPGAGWIGLDATSGLLAGEGHIPLAASPDPSLRWRRSAVSVEKCETTFAVEMTIREDPGNAARHQTLYRRPVASDPRSGRPGGSGFGEGDVRLTMGGEPTFVSATDLDAAEWNTDAVGPTKRAHADRLLRRLVTRRRPAPPCNTSWASSTPAKATPLLGVSTACGARMASRSGATPHCSGACRDRPDGADAGRSRRFRRPVSPNGCRSIRAW